MLDCWKVASEQFELLKFTCMCSYDFLTWELIFLIILTQLNAPPSPRRGARLRSQSDIRTQLLFVSAVAH